MSDAEVTLRALLATVATDNGYQNNVTVTPLASDGANYTSSIFRASISSPNKQDLKLFAKVALISETIRKDLPLSRLYTVEKYFYTKLNILYQNIQDEYNVLAEHRLIVPKCYAFNEEYLSETVVLEDLGDKGFTTYDRMKSIDWEYAARAVEEMAKLHALSFAYAQRYPKEFEQATKDLEFDIVGSQNKGKMKERWDGMLTNALKEVNAEYKDRLTQYLSVHLKPDKINSYHKAVKHPVLVHGDYRASNLMHRTDENGELQVVILDYQTLQTGCAAKDLLYFIFNCSDSEFRDRHYHRLVDHYYDCLSESLQRLHLDPQNVYSRKEFDLEMQEMLPFGLHIALFMLQIVTVDATNAPTLNHESANFLVKTSDLFADRLNGIIKDFATWGVI